MGTWIRRSSGPGSSWPTQRTIHLRIGTPSRSNRRYRFHPCGLLVEQTGDYYYYYYYDYHCCYYCYCYYYNYCCYYYHYYFRKLALPFPHQTKPLVSGIARERAFGGAYSSDTVYGHLSSAQSTGELDFLKVWPTQPLGVNTETWARLSGAPCATADPQLDQLNVDDQRQFPYIELVEATVRRRCVLCIPSPTVCACVCVYMEK